MTGALAADTKAQAVLDLHRAGLWPIPCYWPLDGGRCACGKADCDSPGKHPCIAWKPFQTRRPTEAEVSGWLAQYPEANWGCVLGEGAGVLAVDFDGAGAEQLLLDAGVELPGCATWRSPGGAKVLLRHPGGPLQRKIRLLKGDGCGVDLLADGSQVILPPSRHTRGAYEWVIPLSEGIADAPAALLALVRRPGEDNGNGHHTPAPPLGERIPDGQRNGTLASLAGTMRRRGMSEAAILAALQEENLRCDPPLSHSELQAITHSISRYTPAADTPPPPPLRADALPALDGPVAVLRRMREQGDPISTGLSVLDERLRGGMRPGKAMVIGGTAGAGKTSLGLQIAHAAAEAGCVVACLMADEGREPAIIRLGQQLGYIREQIEDGLEGVLAGMERALATLAIVFPDPDGEADVTLEGVTEALVEYAAGRPALLLVDSIQTVRARHLDTGPRALRERIMDNARTARRLAVEHGLVVIYTSEVNRGWYRAKKEEDRSSDLAAFAEARIEFSADVLLTMRSLDEDPDLVDVRIPKNRLGTRQGFLLRLDRERARFLAVDAESVEATRTAVESKRIDGAVEEILRALRDAPGMTRTQLQSCVGIQKAAFNQAMQAVRKRQLVRMEKHGRELLHFLATIPQG